MQTSNLKKEIQYRLYYTADGSVLTYTVEDLPGNFIAITQEQYAEARQDVKVVNGKLIYTQINRQLWKLAKTQNEGVRTSEYDICILDDTGVNWELIVHTIK